MNKSSSLYFDRFLHALFPFVDFIYILQLEDYNSRMYWRWIQTRIFKRGFQKVGHIVWTKKAQILLGTSFVLYFATIFTISGLFINFWWLLLVVIIFSSLIPHLVLVANIIFSLADILMKKRIILRAQERLRLLNNCTVVAVIGSQGKTTTRHFLCQLLDGAKTYHTPPDNNNVALSVARDILTNVDDKTEVYIVEFGELYRGDLTYLFRFLRPSIIILTFISSQHIAQFGSQKAIDDEFASILKVANDSTILANKSDEGSRRVVASCAAKVQWYDQTQLNVISKDHWPNVFEIDHARDNASAATAAAIALNVDRDKIAANLSNLIMADRRLKTTIKGDITIIDDSYNISPESAVEALKMLNNYSGRKVIVTGGIVDQGTDEMGANVDFGRQIAKVADVVVVAGNILASYVEKGLREASEKIDLIKSAHPNETPSILQKNLKPGDTVLIQNELPDTYWS